MASCMRGCWGVFCEEIRKLQRPVRGRGRTYRRARYSEKELSIEFENLIEEEDFSPRPRRILTDAETELITQKRYDALVEQQKKLDAEIDAQLLQREEDLRLEEEAYYEAQREAAKVAKQNKNREQSKAVKEKERSSRTFMEDSSLSSWLSDDGISLDSTELDVEDFDAFLEKVKARSLAASRPFASPSSTFSNGNAPTDSWEDALAQGVEATTIAGKSLDALHASVDLVAVSER